MNKDDDIEYNQVRVRRQSARIREKNASTLGRPQPLQKCPVWRTIPPTLSHTTENTRTLSDFVKGHSLKQDIKCSPESSLSVRSSSALEPKGHSKNFGLQDFSSEDIKNSQSEPIITLSLIQQQRNNSVLLERHLRLARAGDGTAGASSRSSAVRALGATVGLGGVGSGGRWDLEVAHLKERLLASVAAGAADLDLLLVGGNVETNEQEKV